MSGFGSQQPLQKMEASVFGDDTALNYRGCILGTTILCMLKMQKQNLWPKKEAIVVIPHFQVISS
jgi:hypothetical protein